MDRKREKKLQKIECKIHKLKIKMLELIKKRDDLNTIHRSFTEKEIPYPVNVFRQTPSTKEQEIQEKSRRNRAIKAFLLKP